MKNNLNRETFKKLVMNNLSTLIWNELPAHLKKTKQSFEENLTNEIPENFTNFINYNDYELFLKNDNHVYHIGYIQLICKNLYKVKFYIAKYPIN